MAKEGFRFGDPVVMNVRPWRGKGVFIRYRTKEEMETVGHHDDCYIRLDGEHPMMFPSDWVERC